MYNVLGNDLILHVVLLMQHDCIDCPATLGILVRTKSYIVPIPYTAEVLYIAIHSYQENLCIQ